MACWGYHQTIKTGRYFQVHGSEPVGKTCSEDVFPSESHQPFSCSTHPIVVIVFKWVNLPLCMRQQRQQHLILVVGPCGQVQQIHQSDFGAVEVIQVVRPADRDNQPLTFWGGSSLEPCCCLRICCLHCMVTHCRLLSYVLVWKMHLYV